MTFMRLLTERLIRVLYVLHSFTFLYNKRAAYPRVSGLGVERVGSCGAKPTKRNVYTSSSAGWTFPELDVAACPQCSVAASRPARLAHYTPRASDNLLLLLTVTVSDVFITFIKTKI